MNFCIACHADNKDSSAPQMSDCVITSYSIHYTKLYDKAGSGAATFGVPTSPGVPADLAKHTLTATYNDLAEVRQMAAANKGEIACIILEPIAGNMGCVAPQPGFLQGLRQSYNFV